MTVMLLLAAGPAVVGADETVLPPEKPWTATPSLSSDSGRQSAQRLPNTGAVTGRKTSKPERSAEVIPVALQLELLPAPGGPERASPPLVEASVIEHDPWESFNEKTFSLNRQLDRFFFKPLATVWDTVLPDPVQQSLGNAFDNLGMPRRLVNNLLQLKGKGAGQELGRFLINTTVGVAGFFDVADAIGIPKSEEDTGQTLGVYGAGPGPYLILPFLPPMTVRDGIGFAIDGALDPLSYVLPFAGNAGRTGGKAVNDRSLRLELFQEVEESTLDLYAAVRNAYLQRRQKAIEE